jgi:hypothetical protein
MLSPNNLIKKYKNIGKYRFVRIPRTPNMESALPTTLNECKVHGTDLYRVSWLLQFVEGLSVKQSGSRWSVLKPKCNDLAIVKHATAVCVRQSDLKGFVNKLKECPNKTAVLGVSAADETKVRGITLHAGGQEVHLEVSCANSLYSMVLRKCNGSIANLIRWFSGGLWIPEDAT